MGRPVGTGEHDSLIHVRVSTTLLKAIDEERALRPTGRDRSQMIRDLLDEALMARADARNSRRPR